MKKYVSCFLFFFLLTSASLITLFLMTVGEEAQRAEEVQMQESVEEPKAKIPITAEAITGMITVFFISCR